MNDFASTVGSSIPILGVDLSASQCHQLSADTAWITDDELWRGFLGGVQGEERKYYEVVRDQVYNEVVGSRTALAGSTGSGSGSGVSGLQGVGGGIGGGAAGGGRELKWVWLFSVREGKVSHRRFLLCFETTLMVAGVPPSAFKIDCDQFLVCVALLGVRTTNASGVFVCILFGEVH